MNKYIKYESWEEAAEEIKQSIDDGFVKAVDIAEKAGISKQTISNYLNGIYKPDYNICIKMLKCAGLIYNCDDAYTDADEIEDVSQEIDATNISKKGEMYASRGFLLVHDEKHNEIVINLQNITYMRRIRGAAPTQISFGYSVVYCIETTNYIFRIFDKIAKNGKK